MEGCTEAITLSDLIADQESFLYMTGGIFGDANTHTQDRIVIYNSLMNGTKYPSFSVSRDDT